MADIAEKILLTGEDLLKLDNNTRTSLLELIEGELKEYPLPGIEHSKLEALLVFLLQLYNRKKQWGSILTGEVGFYTRSDDKTVRMADIACISYTRLPADKQVPGYGRIAPELVVEIMSPNDSGAEMDAKVLEWLNFGVLLVWVVYPKTQRIHVYTAAQPNHPTILTINDTLTGSDALPEFNLPISEIFNPQ
jgi:Uma2 family endonuclease